MKKILTIAASVALLGTVMVIPAQAGHKQLRKNGWWVKELTAEPASKGWESRQSFGSEDGAYAIVVQGLRLNGRQIPGGFGSQQGQACHGALANGDVAIKVSTCGDPANVRVRYISIDGESHRFNLRYRGLYE